MNIAVNARVLLKGRMEGVSRYIYETTSRIAINHPEDNIYLFFDRAYDKSFMFSDNVIPVVIPPPTRHRYLWYIWFEWMVPYYLKKYKIDAFYSGDTYLSLRTNVPTLLVSHDLAYLHYPEHLPTSVLSYYKKYFPKFHERADHIIAVSQYTKDDIIRQYNIESNKISVGYNATPEGFKEVNDNVKKKIKAKYSDGKDYFIYIGSMHPRKNLKSLIKAFDLYKENTKSDHKLLLIGRMAWKNSEIEQVYNGSIYKSDIIFTGALFDDVSELLASAIALLYISLFEGFGIPILEGFSSGTPVVTSNVSSMPEVAQGAAIVVNPTDIVAISTAMNDIATDQYLRKQLIEKGKKRALDFNWDKTSDLIYQELIDIARHE